MPDPAIQTLHKETLLKMIENAVGSTLFNSLIVRDSDSNEVRDICKDGEFSCAFFVSSLLTLNGYLTGPNTTVDSLRRRLLDGEFTEIDSAAIQAGDVLFWDKIAFADGSDNEHVGFALNAQEAVSTSYRQRQVVRHPITVPGGVEQRKITLVLRAA